VQDIAFAPDEPGAELLTLDVYYNDHDGLQPIIVNIHGGGWIMGDKEATTLVFRSKYLAGRGYVVASVNYRLLPDYPIHLQVEDVMGAVIWIKENAAEFGADPARVGVTGSSAGGHLAAMVAWAGNDPFFTPTGHADSEYDSDVLAAVPFYGVYDMERQLDQGKVILKYFTGARRLLRMKGEERDEYLGHISPKHHLSPDVPPTLFVCGDQDEFGLYPDSVDYAKRLEELGVDTGLYTARGAKHSFDIYYAEDYTQEAMEATVAWFDRYLKSPAPRPAQAEPDKQRTVADSIPAPTPDPEPYPAASPSQNAPSNKIPPQIVILGPQPGETLSPWPGDVTYKPIYLRVRFTGDWKDGDAGPGSKILIELKNKDGSTVISLSEKIGAVTDSGYFSRPVEFSCPTGEAGVLEVKLIRADGGAVAARASIPVRFEPMTPYVTLYFNNDDLWRRAGRDDFGCGDVFPVARKGLLKAAGPEAAIRELFKGPTAEERELGYYLSASAELQSLTIEDGVLHADFSRELAICGGGSSCQRAVQMPIYETLRQFCPPKGVLLTVDGSEDPLQP
jgi:acetyl esterase/lipase